MIRYSIGQLARRAGVGIETLRFYERRGLLDEPPRTPSGHRRYPEAVLHRVRFVKHAQTLGFSLDEIAHLLNLNAGRVAASADLRSRTREKIVEIDERIAALREIRDALEGFVEGRAGPGERGKAAIVAAVRVPSSPA